MKERALYFAQAVTLSVVKYRILKYSILIPDTFFDICIYSRYFGIFGYSILFRYSVFKSILNRFEHRISVFSYKPGTQSALVIDIPSFVYLIISLIATHDLGTITFKNPFRRRDDPLVFT